MLGFSCLDMTANLIKKHLYSAFLKTTFSILHVDKLFVEQIFDDFG